MRNTLTRLAFVTAGTALAAGIALPAASAAPAPSTVDTTTVGIAHWSATDAAIQNNLSTNGGAAVLADRSAHPTLSHGYLGYGTETLPAQTLSAATSLVTATEDATVPSDTSAILEVRGQRANGSWAEWQRASSAVKTDLGTATKVVQARLTLTTQDAGVSPAVRSVTVAPAAGATAKTVSPRSESYSVFATREGLVGGTTANGHVITENDHFVALPSGTALASNGGNEYQVQVCNGSTCLTEPVWDIGPWNTKDNYWDSGRAEFGDLPVGTPEADAAYNQGYNGGKDEFGRSVANPAGIDLADGVFYDLGMSDNGYITVTYLWT